jgi:ribosomal protein L7/L12
MKDITIAAENAQVLKSLTKEVSKLLTAIKSPENTIVIDNLTEIEMLLKDAENLQSHVQAAVIQTLWESMTSLDREAETEFEKFYGLKIKSTIPAIKSWRLITGDGLKDSKEAVDKIVAGINDGSIKFPHL